MPKGWRPPSGRPYDNFLIIKTAESRVYVNPADVLMVQTTDDNEKIVQRKPVLVLTVDKADKK